MTENKHTYGGSHFGARLGYTIAGFSIGLDYLSVAGAIRPSKTDATVETLDEEDSDVEATDIGAYIGYVHKEKTRFYLVYAPSSVMKLDMPGTTEEFTGTTVRIGVGYVIFSFLTVNIEMLTRTYDEYAGVALTDDPFFSNYAATLSFPINL